MGKSGDELKARRFAHGTVRSSIASAISARSFRRLQVLTVRSHADAKILMQRLDSIVVVV
jgi:hypothetical protein